MEERIEVVALACQGTVVEWRDAVEALLYRLARRHGESPLDRGRALRRRLEELAARTSFAEAYDALSAERGYRWAGSGAAALKRVAAGSRRFEDAAPALACALDAGVLVVALSRADPRLVEAALRPLDGAFDAVLAAAPAGAARTLGVAPRRILHVATRSAELRAAAEIGMRTAWLNRTAAPPPPDAPYDFEWRSLSALGTWLAGRQPVGAAG
jgi:FMN phosphatase YigB (HAD superfamily)